MSKRLLCLVIASSAAIAAVACWWLIPAADPQREDAPSGNMSSAAHNFRDSKIAPDGSFTGIATVENARLTRKSDAEFPAQGIEAPAEGIAVTSPISSRCTPEGSTVSGLPRRDAVNGLGLKATERIRIVPGDSGALHYPATIGSGNKPVAPFPPEVAPTTAPTMLVVDEHLHDPAAWVESSIPLTGTQQNEQAIIADQFAAKISAVARATESAAEDMETAWKKAKEAADWRYRQLFGEAALNQATKQAADAALSRR